MQTHLDINLVKSLRSSQEKGMCSLTVDLPFFSTSFLLFFLFLRCAFCCCQFGSFRRSQRDCNGFRCDWQCWWFWDVKSGIVLGEEGMRCGGIVKS